MATKIEIVYETGEIIETTFEDFCEANNGEMDDDFRDDAFCALHDGHSVPFGGGAAPLIIIRLAA